MFGIKIHLDSAEHAAVSRFAAALHVTPEDVAFAALDRLMHECNDPKTRAAVAEVRNWRGDNLPVWADAERCVHAYECQGDVERTQRQQF